MAVFYLKQPEGHTRQRLTSQVTARLAAVEALFEEGHPGVSALVINRVAHDAQALWPNPDEDAPPLGDL